MTIRKHFMPAIVGLWAFASVSAMDQGTKLQTKPALQIHVKDKKKTDIKVSGFQRCAATIAGAGLGLVCGVMLKKLWCDFEGGTALKVILTLPLWYGPGELTEELGGVPVVAEIAKISGLILEATELQKA